MCTFKFDDFFFLLLFLFPLFVYIFFLLRDIQTRLPFTKGSLPITMESVLNAKLMWVLSGAVEGLKCVYVPVRT